MGGYAGESVSVRFDPRDITTVLIYRREGDNETFLARAYAQDLETEQMSLDEAKASSRIVREKGKAVTNRSILSEVRDRDIFVNAKPTRKERQKAEQAMLKPIKEILQQEVEVAVEITEVQENWEMPALIDYEEMREDYGF